MEMQIELAARDPEYADVAVLVTLADAGHRLVQLKVGNGSAVVLRRSALKAAIEALEAQDGSW